MLRRLGVKEPWVDIFNASVLLFAVIGVGQLIAWADRSPAVTVRFRAQQTSSAYPGDELHYTVFYERNRYCKARVDRWFIRSDRVVQSIDPVFPATPEETARGKLLRADVSVKIPTGLPPGPTQMCYHSVWECSPISRIWPIVGPNWCIDFLGKARPQ